MNKDSISDFYSIVENNIGIALDDSKNYLLESRLLPLSNKLGYQNVNDFINYLCRTSIGDAHKQAFEALTTNETMFFRDKHVFDALKNFILPKIIQNCSKDKTIRIWCSAVSTGQEAYSIAMILREFFPELSSWNIFIQATDFSPNILVKAKSGIYTQSEINRGLDPYFLQKYFTKKDKDSYQINSSIREMVSFLPHNLVDIWPFYPKFELVMLRNVLIYFSQETKNKVLNRTHKHLSSEGVLILGAAESIYLNPLFKLTQLDKISYYSAS